MNIELSQLNETRGYDFNNDIDEIAIDNILGERMAAGDEQAFNLFAYRWRHYILNYVNRRIFNNYDPEDAAEITNDILHVVWTDTRAGCWQRGHFVWFFSNRLSVHTRWKLQRIGRKRRRILRESEAFYEYNDRRVRQPSAVAETQRAMFEDDLSDALLELTPKERLAFMLVFVEGYTRTDIAKRKMIGDISRNTVSRYLDKACEHLQELLGDWR